MLPTSYAPDQTLAAQVTFALKYEGVDLAVLHAVANTLPADELADAIRTAPTGAYMRRFWFLCEWITGRTLPLPDAPKVKAVDVIDDAIQLAAAGGDSSPRHRVRNNLPGTPAFCPLVRRTAAIQRAMSVGLREKAHALIGRTHPDIVARAAAFLLLNDSKASFKIEGESPSPDRTRRWGQAIARAGITELSVAELEALQRIVIGDNRFVRLGLRVEGGFVGEHDRDTRTPLPDHVSARHEDLTSLVEGIIAFDARSIAAGADPVATAAAVAFGFVYVHPFEDGNGRVHRWLIHHTLAAAGFSPPGVVFPVSAVMLRDITAYRRTLESYSRPLLSCIEWRQTGGGNVEVLNDTSAWYRFFDATAHAEYLYACVEETVTRDLPQEMAWLAAWDRFREDVSAIVDMPARTIDLLHRFLRQNDGRLSKRAREREFDALTADEVARVEALYEECNAGMKELDHPLASDPELA